MERDVALAGVVAAVAGAVQARPVRGGGGAIAGGDRHEVGVARGLRALVEDPDPDVVAAAREFALAASGRVLSILWQAHAWRTQVREILLANPHPLPDDALDAGWWLWLSTPERRLWEKLDGRPATKGAERRLSRVVLGLATPAETCAAALSGGTTDVVVAHAVAICRDRGYAPDEPAARAALFVLTGQVARYRDLDPESALLARAYRRAPQRLRRRLRAAMSEVEGIALRPPGRRAGPRPAQGGGAGDLRTAAAPPAEGHAGSARPRRPGRGRPAPRAAGPPLRRLLNRHLLERARGQHRPAHIPLRLLGRQQVHRS